MVTLRRREYFHSDNQIIGRPTMNILRSMTLITLALGIPLVAFGDSSPLINKVRQATAQYRDINVAISQGFVPATPCVSGPDQGAMGVHYLLVDRLTKGVLNAEQPEALIYEPTADGALRLVGVEYIVFASTWQSQNPGGGTPAVEGNLMNYIAAPNRYGLPALYELHIWAWEDNPQGTFADWNTHVTCAKQPVS
jgi:hypothetical protein